MQRIVERKLRQIENILNAIEDPRIAIANKEGEQRSILPKTKIWEAQNLADKIHEVQKIIDTLDDQTQKYVMQDWLDLLEKSRREIISPQILLIEA